MLFIFFCWQFRKPIFFSNSEIHREILERMSKWFLFIFVFLPNNQIMLIERRFFSTELKFAVDWIEWVNFSSNDFLSIVQDLFFLNRFEI